MTPKPLTRIALVAVLGLLAFVVSPAVRADDPPMPPGMDDPGMGDPAMGDPAMADPAMGDPGMADPAAPGAKCDLAEATAELERFKNYLKNKKADNADIIASMDAVMKCYRGFLPADKTVKAPPTEELYLKSVEDELIRGLSLTRIKANSETNDRDDVNIKAAQSLGQTRPHVTADIIKVLETQIFKAKDYKPAPSLVEEAFKAIGMLNDHKVGLEGYIIKEYSTKFDNTAGRPERIKAAWDAMILFKDVSAKNRYEIVKNAIKTYTPPEHAAEVNKTPADRSAKEVWDKIKASVIKAVQIFAKDPKDAKTGNVIATMKGVEDWFRDNDKMGKEPWVDTKPPTAPPGPAPAK